jgi:hypothetical protein
MLLGSIAVTKKQTHNEFSLKKRFRAQLSTYVWKQAGRFGLFLTQNTNLFSSPNTEEPTILVVSLPRSGSSWVGDVLSSASNVRYLREPITQSRLNFSNRRPTIVGIDPKTPPKDYQIFADMAFHGWPTFRGEIVSGRRQDWISQEKSYHVVIKEVNPCALEWFIKRYQPYIIFLVRHPAAVALSFARLGWFEENAFSHFYERLTNQQKKLVQQQLKRQISQDPWEQYGALQGAALQIASMTLQEYPNHKIVLYEDLCLDPISNFQHLFSCVGLQWDKNVEEKIASKSYSYPQDNDPYSTARYSVQMYQSWKQKITPEILDAMKTGFFSFSIPFYTKNSDWHVDEV